MTFNIWSNSQEEPEVPFEGSSEERDFLTIINRKVDPINFSPVESIAKSHMTQKFLYEVIRVLKQKREPYWIGFKQENDFIKDIARFEVKFPGAEYVYGTQYWWIKPENCHNTTHFLSYSSVAILISQLYET